MDTALVTILIPALLTQERDVRALLKMVSEAPADVGASVCVIVQFGSGFANDRATLKAELLRQCPTSLNTVFLDEVSGKWGAIRCGLPLCPEAPWVALVDGDAAYDLRALPDAVSRASRGCDLLIGERREPLIDPSEQGRARSHLEPIVNELLRARLAADGVMIPPAVRDMQSGFLFIRTSLLKDFLARERMDGVTDAQVRGLPELPWSYYGGELHLLAYSAGAGKHIEPCPVFVRYGRSSGLTIEALGRMLRASCLFQDVTIAEVEVQILRLGPELDWSVEELDLARWAAGTAFCLKN